MLSDYIFAYTLISIKYFKIVSPATFVNKSDICVDVVECLDDAQETGASLLDVHTAKISIKIFKY